jgi:L-rhamnose mutarotase
MSTSASENEASTNDCGPAERIVLTITLRPGAEDEYQRRHDEIPAEMVAALHDAGFSEMRLFRHEQTVTIFSLCHPDADTCWARLRDNEANTRWDAENKHMLVGDPVIVTESREIWVMP